MTLRLWPGNPAPSATSAGAADALTLGTQFSVSAACYLVSIWWYSPAGAAALPQVCGIWDIGSQALVCEDAAPQWLDPDGDIASPGDGWVYCDFTAAAVTLAAGLGYVTSVWQDTPGVAWWATTAGYWTTGAGSGGAADGALSAPDSASAANGQGCYDDGGAWEFPGTSGAGAAYYVDVEVSEVVPAFTVTATGGSLHDDIILKVWVVTGGAEAGGDYTADDGYGEPEFTLAPAASGSVIVAGVYDAGGGTALTPASHNATDDDGTTDGQGNSWWYGHYTGTVTEGDAVTLGGSNDNGWNSWAAYEVIPNGTPAIDASTPAAVDENVNTGDAATTAPFSPPYGAVLVAIALTNSSAESGFTVTVSDTSGLGLTWTERQSYGAGYIGASAVFTTTVQTPSSPSSPRQCSPVPAIMTTM